MLSDEKRNRFFQLLKESTKDEWVWMNGYLSAMMQPMPGTLSSIPSDVPSERVVPTTVTTSALTGGGSLQLTVVYGTETGNAKKLATSFVKKLKDAGHNVKLKNTETYKANEFDSEKNLIVIIATHGDGDPPASAKNFVESLKNRTPHFENLNFAVLGLGDTSYPLFCKTGEDVDSLLNNLGGNRIIPLGKCDLDIDTVAIPWFQSLVTSFGQVSISNGQTQNVQSVAKPTSNKRIVYQGKVSANIVLNDIGASKSTRHIEIITPQAIEYEPGDSAGFFPKNTTQDVNQILSLLKLGKEDRIVFANETWMAEDLLKNKVSIRNLPARVIQKYGDLVGKTIDLKNVDLDVLLTDYPLNQNTPSEKVFEILEQMVPRYYSIASSPKSHGENEIHLTVAEVDIETKLGKKEGLCSGYLSAFDEGEAVSFYIQKNPNFRLPPPDAHLIMIGPGTGIAPFRSFLWERDADGASGKNWLFFGERNFVSDFYYQSEFLQLMETGILQKLNAAFSRDTKQKVYVQDRMEENADELLNWIKDGAYIYVCGSKDPMSKDVEKRLLQILEKRTFETNQSTEDFLSTLEEAGRYKKDVY
ncbi:MAG: flavodoxin domain-containing protein [Leptospira sp.]|nr:flavodoxin domain-containing protein [Leptospira sp.]